MTRKLTEEELESKFQAFLQEVSTDEDSVSVLPKQSENQEVNSQLWWLKDHGSADGIKNATKPVQNWLKNDLKKPSTETKEAENSEVVQLNTTILATQIQGPSNEDISNGFNDAKKTTISDEYLESESERTTLYTDSEKEVSKNKSNEDYTQDFESISAPAKLLQNKDESLYNSENSNTETMKDAVVNEEAKESLTLESEVNTDSVSSSDVELEDHKVSIPKTSIDILKAQAVIKEDDKFPPKPLSDVQTNYHPPITSPDITAIGSDVRGIEEILKEVEEIERSASEETRMHDIKIQNESAAWLKSVTPHEGEANEILENKPQNPSPKNAVNNTSPIYPNCFCQTLSKKFNFSCLGDLNVQKILQAERLLNTKLKAEIVAQEKDFRRLRSAFEDRVFRLEEQNVHLLAKVNEVEEKRQIGNKRNFKEKQGDGISSDKIQKEFVEQEKLIIGYQRENETLYQQLATLKNELKANETRMKQENQMLLSDLTVLRNKWEEKERGSHKRIHNIWDNAELERLDSEEWIELKMKDLLHLKEKCEKLMQELQLKANETANLPISESNAEITACKNKILSLENEIRSRNLHDSSSAIVINAKDSKIQSLESQVKQLEQLLNLRNPNSIPALVLATGVAESREQELAALTSKHLPRTVEFLEHRLQEMEEQQLTQANESKSALMAIEAKFIKVKEQYKARIYQLECQLLEQKGSQLTTRPQSSITALEKELNSVRQRYRRETDTLKNEVLALRQELKLKGHKTEEHILVTKVKSLTSELAARDRQIKLLQGKVDLPKSTKDASSTMDNNFSAVHYDAAELELQKQIRKLKTEKQQMFSHIRFLEGKLQATQVESNLVEIHEASHKKLQETLENREEELREANAALDRAVAKITRITNELQMQEISNERLQQQMKDFKVDRKQLDRLHSENADMKIQCRSLREQLLMFDRNKNPEWKSIISLQARVQEVENKYLEKCEELQKIIVWHRTLQETANPDNSRLEAELKKWKTLALTRTQDIERMRLQLDDIILELERLEAQGRNFQQEQTVASISQKHRHLYQERPVSKRKKST